MQCKALFVAGVNRGCYIPAWQRHVCRRSELLAGVPGCSMSFAAAYRLTAMRKQHHPIHILLPSRTLANFPVQCTNASILSWRSLGMMGTLNYICRTADRRSVSSCCARRVMIS